MKQFFLIALFIPCFGNAQTTRYIDPYGSDALGSGTSGSPWKTLYKACDATVANSGDIIHVNAGTYTETVQCVLKTGVSIEGEGVTSIIKSTESRDVEPIINAISSEGTTGNQHISYLKFDGDNLTTDLAINETGRSDFSIHHCSFIDFNDRGVIMAGNNYSTGSTAPAVYSTGNSFHDNSMFNCAGYDGYGRGCLNIGAQDGMLIYNNTITQNSRAEGHNGWPIKYWADGYLRGCKIYNNTFTKIPLGATNGTTGWDFAIELTRESGLEIYNNTFIGGGIDLNEQWKTELGGSYAFSASIHDNIINNNGVTNEYAQAAIVIEYESNTVQIYNNKVEDFAIGVLCTPRPGNLFKDVLIRNNLFKLTDAVQDHNGTFIRMGGDYTTQYYDNVQIWNNTIYFKSGHAGYYGISLPRADMGYIKNIDIKNNILMNASSQVISEPGGGQLIASDYLHITNNDLYNNGSSNLPVFNSTGTAHTNYIFADNISSDPALTGTNDMLLSTSPCIDAGVDVGLPYIGSAPDMGYVEYGTDVTAPTVTSTSPASSATGVAIDANVTITFSENLAGATVTSTSASIGGVTSTVSYASGVITINPNSNLAYSTTYTVTIATAVTDAAGNHLASSYTFSFTTAAAPVTCADIPAVANAGINQTITIPASLALSGSGTASTIHDICNKVLYSEDLTNAAYFTNSIVTANQANDLLGNNTMEKIETYYPASNDLYTDITVVPGTTYYASWDVKRGTATDITYSFYDFTNFANIVAPTSYYASTSSSVQRVQFSFTAPAGCTTVRFAPFGILTTTGSCYIGRVQIALHECDKYATTTSSPILVTGGTGTVTNYLWSQVSGPSATIGSTTSAVTGITYSAAGIYVFKLHITDSNGQTADDEVQVTVNPAADGCNTPATANAGTDQSITLPTTLTLSGSGTGSTLPDICNKVLYSEDLTNGVYFTNSIVTANQANDLLGNNTMEKIETYYPASNDVYTDITVVPGTTYYASWDVKRGTATDITYSFYDFTNFANIVAPTSYYSSTSSSVQRVQFSFTAPAGCTTVRFAPFGILGVTGSCYIGRVQVALHACDQYANTTSSPICTSGGTATINSYTWNKISGPAATITSPASASTTVTGLSDGVYTFKLQVTDTHDQGAEDVVEVTVASPGFAAPIKNAEKDIVVKKVNATVKPGQTKIVTEQFTGLTVTAMPNPSSGYFVIATKANNNKLIKMILMDATGKLIETRQNIASGTKIELGEKLLPGIYFLELIQGTERKWLKLVKQ